MGTSTHKSSIATGGVLQQAKAGAVDTIVVPRPRTKEGRIVLTYRVSVRGSIPANLPERIAAVHAAALLSHGIRRSDGIMSSDSNRLEREPRNNTMLGGSFND